MDNREIAENKRLVNALKFMPEIKIVKRLGAGNRGEAYLLENGKVLKITIDKDEFFTAMILKNLKSKHIIDIYDGWDFECVYDNENFDNLYAIVEEFLDTSSKKEIVVKFVSSFKHVWFSIYFSDIELKRYASFDDLDEYMRHPSKCPTAIEFTKQYIVNEGEKLGLKDEFESFYNQLSSAYVELYQKAPNSHLDLNDGNIGFTPNGILKVFDMQ